MNLFSPTNGASDMHFILCSHRRGIAKFDKILQTSFSYFAKKGPKGTRGNGSYNSFPSKDRQDFKAPTPKKWGENQKQDNKDAYVSLSIQFYG
jgi:hypothetical protein